MPFLLCYKLVLDGKLWAVANGASQDELKKHITAYAAGTTFFVYEVPEDFNFEQRLSPPVGDLAPVFTWSDGGSAVDQKFLETPVEYAPKGGKAKAEFTLAVEGLPEGSQPVVGLFDEEGRLVGRTEVVTSANAVFQKQFIVSGNPKDALDLKFSVYNAVAGKAITKEGFLGCATAAFKSVLGKSVECSLQDGDGADIAGAKLTLTKKARAPKAKKEQQPKKAKAKKEKKADPAADAKALEKKIKSAVKEGGKKGQDISGLNDMGGVSFFHVSLDSPEGDWDMMDHALAGFNKEVDADAEDRKGGAGHLGKMLFSYTNEKLIFTCHLPEVLHEKVKIMDWVNKILEKTAGKVISKTETVVKGEALADPDNGRYSIKMRDDAIAFAYAWLCEQNLVLPDDDSDDEVYGDDDFPDYY